MSLCNLLQQIMLPYLIWKLYQSPFIWGMVAWSAPRGWRVTDHIVEVMWQTLEPLKNMLKWYLFAWKNSKKLYQQMALNPLFQMRYASFPSSGKQPGDRQKGWGNPCFHITPVLLFPSASKSMPQHFGLSLSHFLEQIRLPYLIWKRRTWAMSG